MTTRAILALLAVLFPSCTGRWGTPAPDAGFDRDAGVVAEAGDDLGTAIDVEPTGDDGSDGAPGDEDAGEVIVDAGHAAPAPDDRPHTEALGAQRDLDMSGFYGDRYTWIDSAGRPRTADMIDNDRADPTGNHGGYLRAMSYEHAGATRTCTGSTTRHPGWGYTTNHYGAGGTSAHLSLWGEGTHATPLAGRHHAIHAYEWALPIGGHVVTAHVHWLFATGRDHPVWSVTFDASAAPAGAVSADTRSPYGDLQFDYGTNADVDGVAWGDAYVFSTTSSPVTPQSAWRYDQPNTVPFVKMWSAAADAEMGAVQTQTFDDHPAGGLWLFQRWGESSAGPMPDDYLWPYQLNQYELPATTKSKRMAWGSNFGAVGSAEYSAYGDDRTLSGWPYQSYAVHMVLGAHSDGAVQRAVTEVEAMQGLAIGCDVGHAATSGPGGVARTDDVAYTVLGYDPVFGTVALVAEAGRAACDVTLPQSPGGASGVSAPIVRVRGAAQSTHVSIDGQPAVNDVDVFLTPDATTGDLWITLPGLRAGTVRVDVAP